MRILFLTNFYPPHDLGGWEQNCSEIAEIMAARGHDIRVLTSRHGINDQAASEGAVTRALHLEAPVDYYRPTDFLLRRSRRERENREILEAAIADFEPDVIHVWSMWNLSRRVAYWAERRMPGRVGYAVAGYWFLPPDAHEAYWQLPARRWLPERIKGAIRPIVLRKLDRENQAHPLQMEHVACVSHYVREKMTAAGALPRGAKVIYNGIDPQPYLDAARRDRVDSELRLLYFGGVLPHKGVHTAIEALGHLHAQGQDEGLDLTILGSGHPEYLTYLRRLVAKLHLTDRVMFHERIPRSEIPAFLGGFDSFLFTSIWEEPIARTVMEAMAAGLVVIGTAVGGQCEMLDDGVNALVFAPEDAEGLAEHIAALQQSPERLASLAEAGRQTVMERFTLERMADEIEAWLKDIAR
jgi:glycogen synthase